MKNIRNLLWLGLAALAALDPTSADLLAQGTAFTYQGRLNSGSSAANGTFDLTFALYNADVGGGSIAGAVTNTAVSVTNGLFTVTLDFGNVFNGAAHWLEVGVRSNNVGTFSTLSPRQAFTPAPQSIFASSASNLLGALPVSQLPTVVVTNGASAVTLTGTFGGNFGAFSNLFLASQPILANRLQFTDNPGLEQVLLHGKRNLALEAENDVQFWSGHDFQLTIDHDQVLHVKNNASLTIDKGLTEMVGINRVIQVGGTQEETIGSSKSETVGASYTLSVGNNMTAGAVNTLSLSGNDVALQANRNATTTVAANSSTSIGNTMTLSVGGSLGTSVGDNMQIAVGSNFSVTPSSGGVGIGTQNPQGSLHVYSANNPTVVRVQSTGTPGFGRLEFVSNPQGDVNEWRPGFIQSLDAGNFTGGIGFYVNGTSPMNKFSTNEVMRIQNGHVGIGTTAPTTLLQVGGATCNGTTWASASDRNAKENFTPLDTRAVLEKVAALPLAEWNYKADAGTRHIGPMAQDFHAAFSVGADDKHIAVVDADGVALAAIQGLNEKVKERSREQRAKSAELEARSRKLEMENAELKQRLTQLEQLVLSLTQSSKGAAE